MLRLALSFTALIYGLIVFLARSAYFTYGLLFLLGIFTNIKGNIGFIYGQETVRQSH
jgi:hypothetical protein